MKNNVGVLLNRKKWKKLLTNNLDLEIKTIIKQANLLEINLVFFSIDSIDLKTLELKSAYTDTLYVQEKIKIPKIIIKLNPLYNKNSIRIWRTLLLDRNYLVINEQIILKEKYLLEMMSSNHFLKKLFLDKKYYSSVSYIGWVQLNNNLTHEITAKYCTDENNQILNWSQGISSQFPTLSEDSIEKKINEITEPMLALMNFIFLYYPGINELGFSFVLDSVGNPVFDSIFKKNKVLKDIYQKDFPLWEQLVIYPLEIATLYLKEEGKENE